MMIKKFFAMIAILVGLSFADTTMLKNVENHWLANTGGRLDNHVQNFIENMTLYSWPQSPEANPLLLTGSFWDEGHCSYCAYNTQAGGEPFGKAEWWKDTIRSDRADYYVRAPGKEPVFKNRCQIVNFWGRSFLNNQGAPPKNSAPYVVCSNKDTIFNTVVEDPTALAFDNSGNLLVADNGPDQDIKIFAPGQPKKPIRTFGQKGGVFSRVVVGDSTWLPGQVGVKRFWGIRGLAVDTTGTVYVGNTGMPMQTMGGTDIRAFRIVKNSSTGGNDTVLSWQQQGLAFVNVADADPTSEGRDVYLASKRFKMDYTKKPGNSWSLAAVTLDPFKYPKDPRLTNTMETQWVRRIGGKKFQYNTNMYAGFVYVARFTDTSEIAIPAAFICNTFDAEAVDWADTLPKWTRDEAHKRDRWYWIDQNGDGKAQAKEFGVYEKWGTYNRAIDIDENGNIWFGGKGAPSATFSEGGLTLIPVTGVKSNGVPNIRIDSVIRYSVPFTENDGWNTRLKYLASKDRMYIATGGEWSSSRIYIYENFRKSSPKAARCSIDLGYDLKGADAFYLDQGSDVMTIPATFAADSEYVYVAYLDNGRYSRKRGEVTVYSAKNCETVGWMAPGEELGYFAGAIDIVNGLNVSVLSNGDRVIFEEEDGAGKVIAFKWTPKTDTVVRKLAIKAPVNVIATPYDNSAVVSWSTVDNSVDYAVLMVLSTTKDSLIGKTTDTSYKVIGLKNGTSYKFKVVAYSKDTVSPASAIVSVTPKQPSPTQPTLSSVATSKVVLTWAPVNSATKYKVVQVKNGVTSTLTTTTKLTYSVTLTTGSTYSFKIFAVNTSGESASSNVINVVAP